MTIVQIKDLSDRRGIDPNSIPKHDGGDRGCMAGVIQRGSDTRLADTGRGRQGGSVCRGADLGEAGFYGSATVISLNEQPPLPTELAPPKKTRSPQELLAMLGLVPKKK